MRKLRQNNCVQCSTSFWTRVPTKKFCSFSCYSGSRNKVHGCLVCEKPLRKSRQKYCSNACYSPFRPGRKPLPRTPCRICGEIVQDIRSIHCSRKCRGLGSRVDPGHKESVKRAWWKANLGKTRGYNLKKCYGIVESDYDAMFSEQNGKCAICNLPRYDRHGRLHVDHDHATGKVRALLCVACNNGIGLFKESPCNLISAIAYLSKYATTDPCFNRVA